jgi:putative phage-type endonuclease
MAKLILSVKEAKDHDKWLEVRNMGIGGSDAGVIMGLNSYKSPFQLWMEKTSQIQPEDLSDNEYVYWGTVLEDAVARRFSELTGKNVAHRGTLQSEEYPFMLANVDRMVVGEDAGLECKTANAFSSKKWDGDEIPDSYYCQCLHYMAVTGCQKWYIAVLVGGNHFIWKEIKRNEEDIQALIKAESEFWDKVQKKEMPPVDWTVSCADALKEKFHDNGEEMELPDEAGEILKELDKCQDAEKVLKQEIQLQKNKICAILGDFQVGKIGDRKVLWKSQNGRESIDLKKLKRAADGMFYLRLKNDGFIKTTAPTRVLRIY